MELVLVLYDKLMIRSYEQQLQEYQNKVFDRQVQEVEDMYTTSVHGGMTIIITCRISRRSCGKRRWRNLLVI